MQPFSFRQGNCICKETYMEWIKQKRKIEYIILFLMIWFLMMIPQAVKAEQKEQGRILFISSYSCAWDPVMQQIEGIKEGIGQDAVIDYQFMDTKNVNTDEAVLLFYERIRYFLQNVPQYDVVIAGDDAAFNFVLEYREELFQDTPVIFEGVENVSAAVEAAEDPLICGVVEQLSYQNTLEFAQRIYPDATHVTAILDDTASGKAESEEYYKYETQFPGLIFDEINASELTEEELLQKISALDEDHILIYVICSEDKEHKPYQIKQIIKEISDAAPIPVFSIVPHSMGYGLLGGELVSHKEMGEMAAQMADEILAGKDPAEFELVLDSPREFCFDENVMERFHISSRQLPKDAEIINHKETFLEKNQMILCIFLAVVMALLFVIGILVVDNKHKKDKNMDMVKINEKLRYASHYDALTGLLNRRAFMEDIEELVTQKQEFALIMFDMDNFKQVNDIYGHSEGDNLLKEIASRAMLREQKEYICYRLGGDELIAIVADGQKKVIKSNVEKLLDIFKSPFHVGTEEKNFSCSMGVAVYPKDGETVNEMLIAVDQAMYAAKKSGKSGVKYFDSRMKQGKSGKEE